MQEGRHLPVLIWIMDSNNQTTTDRRDTSTNQTGKMLPLSVLIVPTIATPLRNVMQSHIAQLPHLQGISLAHPVTRPATNFEISVDWCRSLLGHCRGSDHSRKWPHSYELKDRIYCQGHFHHNKPLHSTS